MRVCDGEGGEQTTDQSPHLQILESQSARETDILPIHFDIFNSDWPAGPAGLTSVTMAHSAVSCAALNSVLTKR